MYDVVKGIIGSAVMTVGTLVGVFDPLTTVVVCIVSYYWFKHIV